jgi:hypothetical protein
VLILCACLGTDEPDIREDVDKFLHADIVQLPGEESPDYAQMVKTTKIQETARRRALARHERCITIVEDLERRLDIEERWTPECQEWTETANLVREFQYRTALDRLQALIVSRLLQLSKANMVGTGRFGSPIDLLFH